MHPKSRPIGVVFAALLLLTACGGDSEPEAKPTATKAAAKTEATASAKSDVVDADFDGTPVPEALSDFECAPVKKKWKATGIVANADKNPASFQVTVYVGPPDGESQTARTVRLDDVAAQGSVSFEIAKIPAVGDGPCHVQVLLLDD